jgi:hypothetical protein
LYAERVILVSTGISRVGTWEDLPSEIRKSNKIVSHWFLGDLGNQSIIKVDDLSQVQQQVLLSSDHSQIPSMLVFLLLSI